MYRDEYCGLFSREYLGRRTRACGWVNAKRDMGGVLFIDLVDKTGVLQVVFNRKLIGEEGFALAEKLGSQSVVCVEGEMCLRDEDTSNPRIATGEIELRADRATLLSRAAQLPFSLETPPAREELRLAYRYLDIRRPEMQKNLRFRHLVQKAAQDYLDFAGFLFVETPILTKSTPEGARDYLVPSRMHKGKFYALPQSPQIFKQLLMVGGVDRYYQVARCFRDEDLRADRQPEFTQVDMEMSFVEQEDILQHLEKLFKSIFRDAMGREIGYDFPRMTWTESMDRYGCDKPDLRFGLPIIELTEALRACSFKVFREVIERGGVVRAINIPGGASLTRSDIEALTAKAQSYGANGMAWIAVRENGELYSVLTKYFSEEDMRTILRETEAKPGDFILFCADKLHAVRAILGKLRLDIADLLSLRKAGDFRFLFVTDFPEFEYSEEEKRYVATHHPFTMPYPEDVEFMETDPLRVRAQAYDVVLNGVELGSGSVRIHDSAVQERMFRALGFSEEEIEERFGFMIRAFRYGTPPHGGFAFGLDRLVMLLTGASSLREVIAFPKIKDGSCPMTQAPSHVDKAQLDILGIAAEDGEGEAKPKAARERIAPRIDVARVAQLAMLRLSDEEEERMEKDMYGVVAFADTLSAIDTAGVEPAAHAVPLANVLRADVVEQPLDRETLLSGAPEAYDGFILVPRVME
ncbi:MAG TPA: aspartate--tRNA ligase [Clostridia bacterium]|nr:aspartate--tRNA ligase [Clostridia bacterium]